MTLTPSEALEHLGLAVELAGVAVPEVVLPASRHDVVHGTRLHSFDWGTRGRPAILFLHGGALTARTWDVVCLGLRGDYHCIALDQRGHGDSEWSPVMDYAPESHARDIDGVLDAYGIERAVVVGQSMGGINGFVYATTHPQRVRGLVLVDVGPEVHMAGAQRITEFVGKTAAADSIDAFVEQALRFNPLRDRRLLTSSARANLRQLPDGKWTRKHDARVIGKVDAAEIMRRMAGYWQHIAEVACPALVVRGALSDVFLADAAQRLADALPDGELVTVDGAGHTVQGDNPAGLIAALAPFLARVRD